jgi:glutathione S-transferase
VGLKLHYHPLSSYCWKVLIALYEHGTPFEPVLVNLGDPQARAAFRKLSPFGKMPALEDEAAGRTLWESSVIIEHLDLRHTGRRLIPADADAALDVRLWDRVFDLHLHDPMQRVVADRLRPEGRRDPLGVETARGQIRAAYAVIEQRMAGREWTAGEGFSLADCAAAPALFYAALMEPLGDSYPATAAYLQRLCARPSVARAIAEASPYFAMFPALDEERARLPAA